MQIDSVPSKNISIAALPVKDAKLRRFFILADGKRSWREIYNICKVDEELGASLAEELVDGGYLTQGEGGSAPLVATGDFVRTLSSELANYIGPVAGILVKQLELPEELISKGEIDKILSVVAMEIDNKEEKKQFLANMAAYQKLKFH
jgi:hypothetical protein